MHGIGALEPTLAAAHFNLAGLYEHEGRVDDAIAAYRAALQAFPDSPDAHNNLANLVAERGRGDVLREVRGIAATFCCTSQRRQI